MKKSEREHRRRNVLRCSTCGRKLAKQDARIIIGPYVYCGTCTYWAEKGGAA